MKETPMIVDLELGHLLLVQLWKVRQHTFMRWCSYQHKVRSG